MTTQSRVCSCACSPKSPARSHRSAYESTLALALTQDDSVQPSAARQRELARAHMCGHGVSGVDSVRIIDSARLHRQGTRRRRTSRNVTARRRPSPHIARSCLYVLGMPARRSGTASDERLHTREVLQSSVTIPVGSPACTPRSQPPTIARASARVRPRLRAPLRSRTKRSPQTVSFGCPSCRNELVVEDHGGSFTPALPASRGIRSAPVLRLRSRVRRARRPRSVPDHPPGT